jgi:hypothetical protein
VLQVARIAFVTSDPPSAGLQHACRPSAAGNIWTLTSRTSTPRVAHVTGHDGAQLVAMGRGVPAKVAVASRGYDLRFVRRNLSASKCSTNPQN